MKLQRFLQALMTKRVFKYPMENPEFDEVIEEMKHYSRQGLVKMSKTIDGKIKYITFTITTKAEQLYYKLKK